MASIKIAVLDADGVVVPTQRAGRFEREYGITREMTRGFFEGAFRRCLIGQADMKALLPLYLEQWGWPDTLDEFLRVWFEAEHVVDERVAGVVRALRDGGLTCCLASNQEAHRAAYMRDRMGFSQLFDHQFFSCELGSAKPDLAFYERIAKALGARGQEICFWDDSTENVEGARACGWQAELYTGFEEFETALRSRLDKTW